MSVRRKLLTLAHYHQQAGSHPSPIRLQEGLEWIELITGGRGWVWHEEEWREVLPGTLLWHIEGDQTIARSDPQNPYSCLSLRVAGGCQDRHVPRMSFWHDLAAVAALTEEAIRMFVDESFDHDSLLEYLYSRLRYQALLYHHRRESAGVPEPLRRVRSMIETKYSESLRMEELARAAGWSVAHLHDQFRVFYGTSPRQAIRERRLKAACEQLVGTGLSIKQISANTGFTHSSAFCSAFRQAFGRTPKSYRDTHYFGK